MYRLLLYKTINTLLYHEAHRSEWGSVRIVIQPETSTFKFSIRSSHTVYQAAYIICNMAQDLSCRHPFELLRKPVQTILDTILLTLILTNVTAVRKDSMMVLLDSEGIKIKLARK